MKTLTMVLAYSASLGPLGALMAYVLWLRAQMPAIMQALGGDDVVDE